MNSTHTSHQILICALVTAMALLGGATAHAATFPTLDGKPPLVIGHRGAPGYVPEHTLESYRLAIALGTDVIEPDLVSTKDGVLIARHEPMLGGTTNVASLAKYANRQRKATVDGYEYNDWFAVVIDLAKKETARTGRTISIYPETKHPTWHAAQGYPLEQKLVGALTAAGWTKRTDPVFIQSFEVGNLK